MSAYPYVHHTSGSGSGPALPWWLAVLVLAVIVAAIVYLIRRQR